VNTTRLAPAAGQTVSGSVSYAANATDNAGVSRVEFSLDGTALPSDTTAPYGGTLDTTRLANGTHTLRAVAFDASGASKIDDIAVNIQNTVANTAPTVSISSPAAGQTVSGTSVAYSAIATDNAGVTKVDFSLDGTALPSDTTAPYGGTLDTTKLANGTHTLKAVAYDAAGLSSTAQVSINVQNVVNTAPTVSF